MMWVLTCCQEYFYETPFAAREASFMTPCYNRKIIFKKTNIYIL